MMEHANRAVPPSGILTLCAVVRGFSAIRGTRFVDQVKSRDKPPEDENQGEAKTHFENAVERSSLPNVVESAEK